MKALVIILLAIAIFGSAAYFTYDLFVRPEEALKAEQKLPPPPPPPDPTIPEFKKALAIKNANKLLEARTALEEFIERYPESTKLDEARDALGEVNTDIFLSPRPAPEKKVYIVKSGDVLDRVARQLKTTSELIMRANNLSGTMLQIGQKLTVAPTAFSVVINYKRNKLTVLNHGKFFKQYPIRSWPPQHIKRVAAQGTRPAGKVTGRVEGKISWLNGVHVNFTDKGYAGASHWINLSPAGYTLYSEPEEGADAKSSKPPSGIALAPEHMQELAAMLRKDNPVTIE